MSHLIFAVSAGATRSEFTFTANNEAPPDSADPRTYSNTGSTGENPNLPAPIFGFKCSPAAPCAAGDSKGKFVIEFITDRAPTWGDFYAKDGNLGPVTAWSDHLAHSSKS